MNPIETDPLANESGMPPILASATSPSAQIHQKRLDTEVPGDGKTKTPSLQHIGAGQNVHYSFGQQPFKDVQKSQRFASNAHNSSKGASGGTAALGTGRNQGGLGTHQAYSSMASDRDADQNSREHKSAISMTSVMGTFDQPYGSQAPNIFGQTAFRQQQQQKQSQEAKKLKPPKPSPNPLTKTQENFVKTSQQVDSVEKLVSDGRSKNAERQSQHRLEEERMSQAGSIEELPKLAPPPADLAPTNSFVQNLISNATNAVENQMMSRVPDAIRQEMIEKGFRPSSRHDGQFEYDSDTIERYEMISNEFDYEQVRKSDSFGIKQYKDCIYRGLLNADRQRDGLGVLVYQNGRVYEGEWAKNKRHGRGYEVFANGNIYHGTYEGGKPNGKGVYQWQNGEVYDGEWRQGIKHGYGVWKGQNGESYIGQWVNSKAQGYGVHVFANGDKYEGEWNESLREGNGSDFFANGDCYVGQYAQGKPEGFGQYKWRNGSSYTGQFVNGLKHGHGKWKKKQADEFGNTKCNSYEGMYENDKKHGKGVFEWESGNRYEGNYQGDERHGYGVMKWTDESVYLGMWQNGIQHGIGVMIFPDGVKRAGIFHENVFKESLKRREQIDEFQDQLPAECISILEELLAQRVASKNNLFGNLNMSRAELETQQPTLQEVVGSQTSLVSNGRARESSMPLPRAPPQMAQEQPMIPREQSLDKQMTIVNGPSPPPGPFNEAISDNASVINQVLRRPDFEDKNMTMQKGNPMRDSHQQSIHGQSQPQFMMQPPATASPTRQVGRTIEVQTDLSMVTMEMYSQGYNSKAFMNKTHEFKGPMNMAQAAAMHNDTVISMNSPSHIKYQNDLVTQSNNDFQHVLSKPQFQDTKHQQEILGGGNPNEDTESEWNRNNSSMMVRNPLKLTGTKQKSMRQGTHKGAFVAKPPTTNPKPMAPLISQQRDMNTSIRVRNNITAPFEEDAKLPKHRHIKANVARRQRSNEPLTQPRRNPSNSFMSPYTQGTRQVVPQNFDSRIKERGLLPNRQGLRNERSLQPENKNYGKALAGPHEFMPPARMPKQNKSNFQSLIQTEKSKKHFPQKMFQSQYGNARFSYAQQPFIQQQQAQLPKQLYQQAEASLSMSVQNHPFNEPPLGLPQPNPNIGYFGPPPEQQVNATPPPPAEPYQSAALPMLYPKKNQDTPVVHQNMQRSFMQSQVAAPGAFHEQARPMNNNRFEDILTPSPQMEKQSQLQDYSSKTSSLQKPQMPRGPNNSTMLANQPPHHLGQRSNSNDMTETAEQRADNLKIQPMFGSDYGNDKGGGHLRTMEDVKSSLVRNKTATSSQRTLRYNDFELVSKLAGNREDIKVHLEEDEDRVSSKAANEDLMAYPDINIAHLQTAAKQSKQNAKVASPFSAMNEPAIKESKDSRSDGLRQDVGQTYQYQDAARQSRNERERRHLNSNDTQLASHTINLNASQSGNSPRDMVDAQFDNSYRRVQRSLPAPNQQSRITVKQGISMINGADMQLARIYESQRKNKSPKPANGRFQNTKLPAHIGSKRRAEGSNSHSKGRIDLVGPYAQNLKKPKLYEARGTQKIALKNAIANRQKQHSQTKFPAFTNDNFGKKGSFLNSNVTSGSFAAGAMERHMHSLDERSPVDDRADKHTHRFSSQGRRLRDDGPIQPTNYVIQHQSLMSIPAAPNKRSPPIGPGLLGEHVQPHKRVWVPYNKKMKLRGMQQSMAHGRGNVVSKLAPSQSALHSNPLMNSQ